MEELHQAPFVTQQILSKRVFLQRKFILAAIIGIVVICILLIASLVTLNQSINSSVIPTSTPLQISGLNMGEIVIADNKKLFLFDISSMKKETLPVDISALTSPQWDYNKEFSYIAFTPDGRYLLFSYLRTLFIYDFQTKQTSLIQEIGLEPYFSLNSFSPNILYAIGETRTGPGNGVQHVIDIVSKKYIDYFVGFNPQWASDSSKFVYTRGDVNLDKLDFMLDSLYLGEIKNGSYIEKKLLNASNKKDYAIKGWRDDKTILVAINDYKPPFPLPSNENKYSEEYTHYWWNIYNHPKTSYVLLNVETGELRITLSPTPTITPKVTPFFERASYSKDKQWKVVVEKETVYISKSGTNERIKISKGVEAIWRPW